MKKLIEFIQRVDWKSIPKTVYLRYIAMIVVILNTILTRLGINPIEVSSEAIYQNLSDTVTILILLMNTWKNNPVTTEAIEADKYMKDLKAGKAEPTNTEE